ncbi:putative toxin-antitoxin system toxin component, PIN family [Variovorax saccharolyticus]|uniref:putative toxin-antitoxin system toxin component, PIN family n=1 Tax=Variovorax saccharolyticus TaxID=3053516 RepID=UPI002578B35B|nr:MULTISPECIES: putative toxin-antitoxin system toxin component, PIN family [unclassified Variovorax]MDM0019735.1 putative toxin-antitoxin system toxin component, PIN family [Variovorax sp. J22R187]MDM0027887.1 putative toxin-antitoxin system toxin component, PIN family [Variovorax sp. J31P216]
MAEAVRGRAGVVIDTNIALDLLVFEDPGQEALTAALANGELEWIATAAMRDELARVLGYPLIARRLQSRGLQPDVVLAAWDARTRRVEGVPPRARFVCKDPDDQVFIDLAVAHGARLLSKDRAVLAMRKRLASCGVPVSKGWAAPGP